MRKPSSAIASRRAQRPRVGILSLSVIPDDPRVRRQGDLLAERNWEVVAVGMCGHRSPQPSWSVLTVGDEASGLRAHPRALTFLARNTRRLRRGAELARLSIDPAYADVIYWRLNAHFHQMYSLAQTLQVDLWLANDWTTLPIAARLAAEQGVPYAYDTHELAADEYWQSRIWRWTIRPLVVAVEGKGISRASFMTCVSDGIADRLVETYKLSVRPLVVRNMPMYCEHAFRRTDETVEVLYHGAVVAGRGLEACIRSVAFWRPGYRLTIRGPSLPSYLAKLKALAITCGVATRVSFQEPVPMTDLIARAAAFDVGLFVLPDHSLHNMHALPNKFFEYLMAGLALCVSNLPEMVRLVRQYDLGELIPAPVPRDIASCINRLDRSAIDRFKANALRAARELNWEAEGSKLVAACEASLRTSHDPLHAACSRAPCPDQRR